MVVHPSGSMQRLHHGVSAITATAQHALGRLQKATAQLMCLDCFGQGGIGPAGLASEDLHVLDFTDFERPRWHR